MEEKNYSYEKTVNEGMALGTIFNHVVNEPINNYSKRVLKKIIKKIEELICDEEKQFILTLSRFDNYPQIDVSSHYVSNLYRHSEFKKLLKEKIFVEKKGIALALDETYTEFNETHKEEYLPFFTEDVKGIFERERILFLKRLLVRIKKDLLYHKIKSLKDNTILFLDEFEIEFLDQIPRAIKGIIANKNASLDIRARHYLVSYNLPLIIYNKKIKNGSMVFIDTKNKKLIIDLKKRYYKSFKTIVENEYLSLDESPIYTLGKRRINVFLNINDPRYKNEVKKEGWFNQTGIINTEILYGVKGSVMDKEEVCYRLTQIIKGLPFSEVIFQIPDFGPNKSCNLNGENKYTDLLMLEEFRMVFLEAIRGIAMASRRLKNTKILLPMLVNVNEIEIWKDFIMNVFLEYTDTVPEIGVTIETDAFIDRGEQLENKGVDFSILDLDDLSEEIIDKYSRYDEIDFTKFEDYLMIETQQYHQSLRSIGLKHGISGHALENPKIIRRIMTQGFLNLYLSYSQIKKVAFEILSFTENEGKFKNYYIVIEERREKAQKNQEELTLALKTERQKRSRIYNTKAAKPRKRI